MVKFGVVLPVYGGEVAWESVLKYAKAAEKFGYDSLWISDHLLNPYLWERDVPDYFRLTPNALEVWTVLSALAVLTTKCRLGTYVICNNFRHPSMLAQMSTTLDIISKGRLELAIGAGWLKKEHISFGFWWDKHSSRIERLKEAVKIIKKLWTENHVSYHGKYFQLKDATLEPKPVQKPHPSIWIGGNSKAIKSLVAEVGDGWIPEGLSPKDFSEGANFIRRSARDFGRDSDKIMVAWGGGGARIIIAENREVVEEMAKPIVKETGKPIELLPWIIGTPEECIEKIDRCVDAGATRIVAGFADFPSLNGLELFSKKVIPHFR